MRTAPNHFDRLLTPLHDEEFFANVVGPLPRRSFTSRVVTGYKAMLASLVLANILAVVALIFAVLQTLRAFGLI